MKKFLLIAALILALVTSLSAGTMAAYSTNVATIANSAVNTKAWTVTATDRDAKFANTVKLAPGDSAIYKLVVTSASEVSSDLNLAFELKDAPKGMSINCDKGTVERIAKDGTVTYTFTVDYDYELGTVESAACSFDISVNATSVNEGNTEGASIAA